MAGSVRRHLPLIGIAVAVALAIGIVVAGSRIPGSGANPSAAASLAPEHPNAGEPVGMVDAAEVERQIATLERAHEANPTSIRITLNLGDAYYLAQRLDEAAACYREALSQQPGHPSAVVRIAMVWHARGLDARAVKAIQEVLEAMPDNQEAHYDLAVIYFSMEDVRAARTEWVKAARIDPRTQLGRTSQNFVDLLAGQSETPPPSP